MTLEFLAKSFSIVLVISVVIFFLWVFTDIKHNFKLYRKSKGGKWYKYECEELDDYFWSDDMSIPCRILEIEEYRN